MADLDLGLACQHCGARSCNCEDSEPELRQRIGELEHQIAVLRLTLQAARNRGDLLDRWLIERTAERDELRASLARINHLTEGT